MAYTSPFDIQDDDPEFQAFKKQFLGGGDQPNAPGFVTGIKQGLGGFTSGIGQVAEDLGWKNNPIKSYGDEVQANNPSSAASQSWEGFKESPWQGIKEFAGQGIGSTLPSLAAFALPGGQGAAATGMARVGQVARGLPMQTALAAAPIYGQVREDQQKQGFDDIPSAAAAAIGGGIVESKLGIQRVLGKNTEAPLKSFVNELASSPLKTGLKTWGRTGLEEGAEEILQQPMQQLGAHRNPLTEESLRDTAWSGFGGLIGGLALGGLGGAKMGLAHKRIDDFRQQDLLNPNTPLNVLDDQAKWNRAFIERDQGVPAGEHYYNQRQGEIDQYIEGLVPQMQEQQRLENAHRIFDVLNTNGGFTAEGQGADILNETFGIGQKPVKQQYARAYNEPLETPIVVSDNSGNPITLSTVGEAYDYRHGVGKFAPQAAKVDALGYPISPYQPVEATQQTSATPSWVQYGVEPTQGDSNVQPTQVAQGSNQVQGGNAGGSAGNTSDQSGVGRGRDNVAGTPVGRGGANQLVGSTSGGVGAVNPATTGFGTKQKALWNDAIAKLGEGHQALESINQTITSGKLAQAAKEIEQAAQPKDARTLAEKLLASLPKGRKGKVAKEGIDYAGVLSTFVGFDGNNDEKLEAVAKAHGYNDRQRAHQIIYGYTTPKGKYIPGAVERLKDLALKNGYTLEEAKQAIVDLGFARGDQYGLSEDQKEIAAITGSLATGISSPNQGKLDFKDAQSHGLVSQAMKQHNMGDSASVTGKSETDDEAALAAEQAIDDARMKDEDLNDTVEGWSHDPDEAYQQALLKFSGDVGKANAVRNAVRAFTKKQVENDIKAGPLVEKQREASMMPKYDFTPEQYAKAEEFWDELLVEDDIKFSELSQERKDRYTQLVVEQLSHPSGHVDFNKLDAQQELLKYEEQVDGKQSKTQRFAAGTTGQVESSEAGTDRGTQSAEPEEVVQPSRSESASEEISAEGVISRWNQAAKALGVTTWDGLSSEQQNYILGSGTWEEFDEAAGEVLDEINDDQGAAKFSESNTDKGVDPQKLSTTLRKLFFSPEKFNKLVSIFPNAEAIPADVKAAAAADAKMSVNDVPWEQVQGFAMNGKVYLVAGNIKEGNELGVFLHELGVHVGMEKLIGKANMQRLSSQIEQWAANDNGSKESKLAKDAVRRAEGSASEDRQQEVIAYFVEEAVKAGINPTAIQKTNSPLAQWFRSLWAAAKLALRKIGLGRFDQLNAQNIVDLSYGAAKMELTGTWHGTAADFRNFDHSYMGSGEGAQAFGWGTYLAQRPGIAKGYWKADVKRKKNGGSHYDQVFIDGAPIHRSLGFDNDAFYFEADMLNGDETPAQLKQAVLTQLDQQIRQTEWAINNTVEPENIDEEERKWRAEYQTRRKEELDGLKAAKVTIRMMHSDRFGYPPENNVEGSLMRVDTAVHDDEMLDWDKPLSEQNQVRIALMPVRKEIGGNLSELTDIPWNEMDGLNLIGNIYERGVLVRALEEGYVLPKDAATEEALREGDAYRATSLYLDSIGIKGIKFLDSQSRDIMSVEAAQAELEKRQNLLKYKEAELAGARVTYAHKPDSFVITSLENNVEAAKRKVAAAEKQLEEAKAGATRNLVIFNDKNIQRVVTQVGADRDKVKFSQADVTRINPQYRQASTLVKQVLEYVGNKFQSVENNLMFGHQLAEKLQRLMPGTDSYIKSLQKRQTERVKHEQEIARIASAYNELDTKQQNALNAFVQKSTMDGKWGFKPTWFEKDVQTAVDATMKTQFDALTPAAQQIVKDMFKFGSEQQKRFDESVNANITDPKKKVQRNQMYGKPYAPLKRFGDHVVVGKSAAFVAEEKANPGSKRLAEMKADPKHYYVEFTDGNWEAIKRRDEMASANPALSWLSKPLQLEDGDLVGMNFTMLEKLKRQIEASDSKSSKATKSALSSLANQLYIQQLNHLHANKSQAQRLNVKGADTDMMRAFVTQGRAEAALIANLRTHAETEKALQQIQTAAREGSNQDAKTRVANAVLRRHLAMLDFKPTPIQNKLMGANSFMMLLTSPAYYLTNATQPFVVSLPYMAGRFGGANSWNTLRDAYKTTLELVKLPTLFKDQNLDTAHLRKFNSIGREADALQTLLDENLVNVGMEMELGDIANQSKNPAWKHVQKGMQVLKTGVANVEILNRLSSAVAGYRLAYTEAINKGQSTDAAHDAGVEYARKLVIDTHGDYAGYNAPTVMMQGAFGNLPVKLMTQFKKFQFIQAGLLIGTFRDAYLRGNLNPTGKAAAKAMFKWMLGTQAALAGVLGGVTGVPMALLGSILAGAFGDDGEDKEAFLRRVLGGGAFAQLILHGAPAAAGVDISKRVGMGAALDPFRMADPQTDWSDYALSLAGPSAGLASRTANGLGYMGKGQYWKGLEMLMPSGVLTNASKIARYESEGLTNTRGDVVMKPEEISLMTDIMQGMGLETTQLSDRRWKAGAVYDRGIHFKEQTAKLQRDYVEAIKDGDQGEVSEIRQKWMKLQAERVKQGFKRENMTALTQAPMAQKKRERDTINGLQSTQTNKKFVESIDAL